MNLSQFCNIILFSKPAARHTNKDSLLYSTTPTSGGRFAYGTSAGFTLVEALVAMVILLVGIWTLAVSFPKLLGVVATQEKRTEMALQAERTLDQLTRYPNNLPLAIAGLTPDIDATGQPEDPTISDFAITPPNARDDVIEVIGERFTVPAPLPPPYGPPAPAVHVFRQGLAASVQGVYQEIRLPDSFSVAPNGTVNFDGAGRVEINYAWVESGAGGKTHHVYREVIDDPDPVAAQSVGSFGQVLPISISGLELLPVTPTLDPSGALLLFDEGAAGARMRVNYKLLTDPERYDRRALIMSEDHRIVSSPQIITLVGSHLDDTSVLAVDLSTGELLPEGPGLEVLDAAAGEIEVRPDPILIGHDVRFYYVTLDQDMISVQIAPATFVDDNVASADDLYRSYLAAPDVIDPAYTALLFYACNAGHTVSVDYKWNDAGTIVTVNGEMHTISPEPGNHYITLNGPNVEEIIAVRGKSLQAIAWWRTPNGRLIRMEIMRLRG